MARIHKMRNDLRRLRGCRHRRKSDRGDRSEQNLTEFHCLYVVEDKPIGAHDRPLKRRGNTRITVIMTDHNDAGQHCA